MLNLVVCNVAGRLYEDNSVQKIVCTALRGFTVVISQCGTLMNICLWVTVMSTVIKINIMS